MKFETKTLEPFYLLGLSVRTTNEANQSQKDIGDLWQRFFSQNIIEQIPGKANNDIYCVYTDYETDATGAYTTLLGCRVASLQNLPDGLAAITIPETTYRVYKSVGKLPNSVLATWQHIWQTDMNRAYTTDFDVYGPKSQDSNQPEVETYVAVA